MSLAARTLPSSDEAVPEASALGRLDDRAWAHICFYSTPIGEEGSELRRHSDVFLEQLVRPAIRQVDPEMTVVRSDELSSSTIMAPILEFLIRARLVVGDLSFHNASVFYEIGIRHLSNKPCVLISRTVDEIPANFRDLRMVRVDTTDRYEFADEIPRRRSDIASHARWALSPAGGDSGPVTRLFPGFRDYLN